MTTPVSVSSMGTAAVFTLSLSTVVLRTRAVPRRDAGSGDVVPTARPDDVA